MGDVGYRTICSECAHLHCCPDSAAFFLPCRLCDCELRPRPEDGYRPEWEFATIWTDNATKHIDWSDPPPRVTQDVLAKIAAPGSALRRYLRSPDPSFIAAPPMPKSTTLFR